MSTTLLHRITAPALPFSRLLWRGLVDAVDYLMRCYERSRQRRILETLDDGMLRDLGLKVAMLHRTFATVDHIIPTDQLVEPYRDPLAQAMRSFTALTPRSVAVTPLV